MKNMLIKEYVNNLGLNDIYDFARRNGVSLTESEANIIYRHIKNDWQTILSGNYYGILNSIKPKVNINTYNKIEELLNYYKNKYQNFL